MNERIRELAKEAVFDEIGKDYSLYFNVTKDKVEKFAKLVVNECMNICEQQRLKILNNPNDPSWTEHLAECQTTMEQTFLRS